MAAPEFKILCIDDEPAILENYEAMISDLGYDAIKCTDASKALQLIEANRSTLILVISDQKMPGLEGTGIRAAMLAQFQDIPFIIVSGFVSRELALEAVNLKIAAFLEKPVRHQDLAACIEREGKNRLESLQERKILEKTFLEEANSLLEEVEPLILTLETDPHDKDAVNAIFRLVHTVKGSSGVLEAEHLTRFAHSFEDLISQLKMGEVIASKEVVSKMLFGLDVLKDMLASYSTRSGKQFSGEDLVLRLMPDGGTAANSPPDNGDSPRLETTAKKAPRDSLEVPTAMLDEVMALGGEITVIRNMVNKLVRSIEKANPGNRDVALLTELLDEMHKINGAIQTKIVRLVHVPQKGHRIANCWGLASG
ncbi:MAG: response regulator [Proteobacteria bacterium]|nr:response regulator [Pseudomonadota bacterium]